MALVEVVYLNHFYHKRGKLEEVLCAVCSDVWRYGAVRMKWREMKCMLNSLPRQ